MRYRAFVVLFILLVCLCCARAQNIVSDLFNKLEVLSNEADLNNSILTETARKKKRSSKYLIPFLFAAIMIKAVLFPLAVKFMAVMSTIAVFLSTLSLIVSSIVGYAKLAMKSSKPIKVVRLKDHHYDHHYDTWAKDDGFTPQTYYEVETVQHEPHVAENHHYYVT